MIKVYNINEESHTSDKNNFYIGRGSALGNPYTHLPLNKTMAIYQCRTRDESIDKYSTYYDTMYGNNINFTKTIDMIYECYKNGEDVYLGCYCKPLRCHGDIIVEKLQKRLLKEKIRKIKEKDI